MAGLGMECRANCDVKPRGRCGNCSALPFCYRSRPRSRGLRMRTTRIITGAVIAAWVVCTTVRAEEATPVLWYAAPAADWEREALPIGNGALGAMISGGVELDRVQFNEKTLWTGGPGS